MHQEHLPNGSQCLLFLHAVRPLRKPHAHHACPDGAGCHQDDLPPLAGKIRKLPGQMLYPVNVDFAIGVQKGAGSDLDDYTLGILYLFTGIHGKSSFHECTTSCFSCLGYL